MILPFILRRAVAQYSEKGAIVSGDSRFTYSMFGQRVHCLARYPIPCRIGKGECLGRLRSDLGWRMSPHGQDFNPPEVLRIMEREKVTLSNMIPTMLNMLVNTKNVSAFDFSNQRVILRGGAPIAQEVVRKIMDVLKCDYIQI